jgi:ribosomal protein S18 acetylase RimI-like enzyme
MRPARPEDLPRLMDLWRREVALGRQDVVPNMERMRGLLERFDWETRSRVLEEGGALCGAVLVTIRPSPEGPLANLYAAGDEKAYLEVIRWGVLYARAASVANVQVFAGEGCSAGLETVGLSRVRPWWRMDRPLGGGLPDVEEPPGYAMLDGDSVPPGEWVELFNAAFADHWRFASRGAEEILAGKASRLCLMVMDGSRRKGVAMALADLERYEGDRRPQPVGLISSVGTLPEHRRRGLARWLVTELTRRLAQAGAPTASLYVDGMSPMGAPELYRKLGYEVAFTAEVWEASYR